MVLNVYKCHCLVVLFFLFFVGYNPPMLCWHDLVGEFFVASGFPLVAHSRSFAVPPCNFHVTMFVAFTA
jgi:hypothetical protein